MSATREDEPVRTMIRNQAKHATSTEVEEMLENDTFSAAGAAAVASWWQSGGSVGSALYAYAAGSTVHAPDVLDDIARTIQTDKPDPWNLQALVALAAYIGTQRAS